ncbi:hypothetical protein pEaSNUABM54_00200 [Erwinia phage pEa_SNUABM_54]|nr:hypothetical protein pEaSNUABM54_00200 [Erwinia phage pEa_SNUABM_54]
MSLMFHQLYPEIRDLMVEEIENDIRRRGLYYSRRLSANGFNLWPDVLLDAAYGGDDETLTQTLLDRQMLITTGTAVDGRVLGHGYAQTLAEGEFNRYYIRGICAAAVEGDIPFVTVYRAKRAWAPRPESDAMLGSRIDSLSLLNDLRNNVGRETQYGIPNGPNSGLTVEY